MKIKAWKLRIAVYSLLIPALVALIVFIMHKPIKVNNSSLGNELSAYFYSISTKTTADLQKEFKSRTSSLQDEELAKFYQKLSWKPLDSTVDFKSDYYHTFSQVDLDGTNKRNFVQYWQNLRPVIRNIYAKNIQPKNVPVPVVHFRCSDTPFVKCLGYNLTKASSVKWMAEQIKDRGYDEIILLACSKHKSNSSQQSCGIYAQFYSSIFEAQGIKVVKQCNSIYDDFTTMVNSPVLVSLNTSSYAFMAGIAKDPQNYISCNMGLEYNNKYYPQTEGDWIFDSRQPLLHSEVKDYHDTADVISKLKN